MIIHQMDVITAFTNGTLDEEIYMQQPYEISGKEGLACRLKSLLSESFKMKDMGFLASSLRSCVSAWEFRNSIDELY